MRKKLRQLLALLLALTMVMSLAACQPAEKPTEASKKTDAPEPDDKTEAPADETEAPKEYELGSWALVDDPASKTGTVRFWSNLTLKQGMQGILDAFNEAYPNITVEFTSYSNNADGNAQANAAIMGGEIDVLMSSTLQHAYNRWNNNLYLPLTDYIEEYGIDVKKEWGTDSYNLDGVYYTFPVGGNIYYIVINKTAWDEAGLGEIPTEWTWDEYLAASEAMTKRDEKGKTIVYGGSDFHSIEFAAYPWMQVTGKHFLYTEDGQAANFTDPIVLNMLKREIKAEQEDGIWFPLLTYRDEDVDDYALFLNGDIASFISNNFVKYLRDTETYPRDFKAAFAPYPVEEKGQTNYMSGVATNYHVGITNGVQDEDAAWTFLSWFSTYGSQYMLLSGNAPKWLGADISDSELLCMVFDSEERAAELIDIDSWKSTMYLMDAPIFEEHSLLAYTDVLNLLKEYVMLAHRGEMTPEDAMQTAKELADAKIKEAQ
ncbi:MAG: extracellular solute-binding protein [Lachnospiraceae bacterium]|nr:extracellular solute-binding protein [Lachnospiraceae bacterium]